MCIYSTIKGILFIYPLNVSYMYIILMNWISRALSIEQPIKRPLRPPATQNPLTFTWGIQCLAQGKNNRFGPPTFGSLDNLLHLLSGSLLLESTKGFFPSYLETCTTTFFRNPDVDVAAIINVNSGVLQKKPSTKKVDNVSRLQTPRWDFSEKAPESQF